MKTVLMAVSGGRQLFRLEPLFLSPCTIERAYAACVSKLDAGMNIATADINAKIPTGNDPSAALAKGMGDAMTSMVQGMTVAMGGATCALIRDTCKQNFDGSLCQAALGSGR